jgi:hypothetical protein
MRFLDQSAQCNNKVAQTIETRKSYRTLLAGFHLPDPSAPHKESRMFLTLFAITVSFAPFIWLATGVLLTHAKPRLKPMHLAKT